MHVFFFFFFFNSELKEIKKNLEKENERVPESKQNKEPKSASTQSTKASNGLHWSFCLFFSVAKPEHGIDYCVMGLSLFVSRICFTIKLKILHTICSMKSVNEFCVILLLVIDCLFVCFFFFLFIVYNTQIVKQDSCFELMLYGLLLFFFFRFFLFLLILN